MATAHQASNISLSLIPNIYRKTRSLFIAAMVVGLVATNVATLISDTFHNSLYGALSRLVTALPDFHGKKNLLQKSPTSVRQAAVREATRKLQAEKSTLIRKNADLAQRHNNLINRYNGLANSHNTLRKQHLATQKSYDDLKRINKVRAEKLQTFSTGMAKRSVKIATANVAALPAELIPAIGTATIVGLAALDIYLLCDGMKELNTVKGSFGLPQEDANSVCGVPIPDSWLKQAKGSYDEAVSEAKKILSW